MHMHVQYYFQATLLRLLSDDCAEHIASCIVPASYKLCWLDWPAAAYNFIAIKTGRNAYPSRIADKNQPSSYHRLLIGILFHYALLPGGVKHL